MLSHSHILRAATLTLVTTLVLGAATATRGQATTKPTVSPKGKTASKAKGLLDLNKATAKEFEETIPGVGPATAKKIVAGRPYTKVDDLAKAGIPARIVEAIRPHVTVGHVAKPPETKGTVDINTAAVSEIETLPGIGPAHAKAIVAGRPYKSVDDLERVKGLGKTRIEALRGLVTASASTPAATERPTASTRPGTTAKKTTARPSATATGASKTPIDLNTASVAELETLPDIGPARAKAIVADRPYKSVDDLERVKGLGKTRIEALRGLVTASADAPATADESTAAAKPATKPAAKSSSPATKPTAKSSSPATKPTAKSSSRKPTPTQPVNINTASLEELQTLYGIGPVKAQAIIDARPFKTIEDIMKVKGIKEGEFSKIKDVITVE